MQTGIRIVTHLDVARIQPEAAALRVELPKRFAENSPQMKTVRGHKTRRADGDILWAGLRARQTRSRRRENPPKNEAAGLMWMLVRAGICNGGEQVTTDQSFTARTHFSCPGKRATIGTAELLMDKGFASFF